MSAVDQLFESKKKKGKKTKVKKSIVRSEDQDSDAVSIEKPLKLPEIEVTIKTKKQKEKEKKLKAKLQRQPPKKVEVIESEASEEEESVVESEESESPSEEESPVKEIKPVEIKIKTKKEKEREKKLKLKLEKQQKRKEESIASESDDIQSQPPIQVEIRIKSKKEKLKEKKLKEKLQKQNERKPSPQATSSQLQQAKSIHQKLQNQQQELEESWDQDDEDQDQESNAQSMEEPDEEQSELESENVSQDIKDDKPKIVYSDKKKKKSKKPAKTIAQIKLPKSAPVVKPNESEVNDDLEDWEKLVSGDEAAENISPELSTFNKSKAPNESKSVKVSSKTKIVDSSMEVELSAAKEHLRSPICCILGHVDTGKTKLLDNIRQTNVQGQEHGGITQQIGATFMPIESIKKRTSQLPNKIEYKIPGILCIDTPGHESFTNLRSRGSSLCNIAILVVDIMHGLEPQTIESLNLLKSRKTPFIVALNKIDRLYGFKAPDNSCLSDALKLQNKEVMRIYNNKLEEMILLFAEQGFNAQVYYKNKSLSKYISLVPVSAFTGIGVPDLLQLLIHLTQSKMTSKLTWTENVECTVLEVKVVEGLGTCIDVILVNGVLHCGDTIILCGMFNPIKTQIRALLTPQPMKEMRVKSVYKNHPSVTAAMGVRICADDLESVVAGCRLFKVKDPNDENEIVRLSDMAAEDYNSMDVYLNEEKGVHVQASTLGSLEALLVFLKDSDIPVHGYSIGPVHKKDVLKAGQMMDHFPEYGVMLIFDVLISKEVEELANETGLKLFKANVIYHLFDQFMKYHENMIKERQMELAPMAVFPCVLHTITAFNKRDPIILGVDVVKGVLKIGTTLCVKNGEEVIKLGKVTSIEKEHKQLETVRDSGGGVAIKIESTDMKQFGRHFTEKDVIYSMISRQSIDILKETFRDDLEKEDWQLIVELKQLFKIK